MSRSDHATVVGSYTDQIQLSGEKVEGFIAKQVVFKLRPPPFGYSPIEVIHYFRVTTRKRSESGQKTAAALVITSLSVNVTDARERIDLLPSDGIKGRLDTAQATATTLTPLSMSCFHTEQTQMWLEIHI